MTPLRIIGYVLVICLVLLCILLSILRFENTREFIVGKWAVCGVLAVIAIGLLLLELRYFSKPTRWRILPWIKAILIPMLVLVLASIVLIVLGYEELSSKLFLRAPFEPVIAIFLSSITAVAIYLWLATKQKAKPAVWRQTRDAAK